MALGLAHPALLGQHHGHRLGGHEFGFGQGLGLGTHDDGRATSVAVGLGVLDQFVADQIAQLLVAAQQGLQALLLLEQLGLFATDLHLFQPRQLAQAGFEDVVGLVLGELEAGHQCLPGMLFGTDDVDHLVQVEKGDQQAVQQVQAAVDLVQAELQAATHRADAIDQPLLEDLPEVLDLGLAVQADDVEVDPVAGFEIGGGEQVLHQFVGIDAVGARHDDDAGRVLVVRLVTQVGHHGQLLGLHLGGDLLQHLGTGDLVRQCGDDHVAVFTAVDGTHAHRAAPGLVDFAQVGGWRDDLGFGGEVRTRHMLEEFGNPGDGIVQQAHAGSRHLTQVVRRDVGGHAHGDAGGAVEQQVGQACRQHRRFVQGAIEVGHPVHGALPQFIEQHLGIARQPRLGIAHGGKGLGIVRRTPVALAIHQWIAIGERLGHQHHGFVAGRVAMGVVLTEHVTHGTGGFLVLGVGIQAQFAHGIDDAALDRLETVTDVRQGAVHDDVHGVVQVRLLGEVGQRTAFDAIQAQVEGCTHGSPLVLRL